MKGLVLFLILMMFSCQKNTCDVPGIPQEVEVQNHTAYEIIVHPEQGLLIYKVAPFDSKLLNYTSPSYYDITVNGKSERYFLKNNCVKQVLHVW